MIIVAVLLVALVVTGYCVARGWCADTRDPDFSLGEVIKTMPSSRKSRHPRMR